MKAKIDNDGYLYLERAGEFKRQHCPFTATESHGFINQELCGDWCPLFIPDKNSIQLCHHVIHVDEVIDLRRTDSDSIIGKIEGME